MQRADLSLSRRSRSSVEKYFPKEIAARGCLDDGRSSISVSSSVQLEETYVSNCYALSTFSIDNSIVPWCNATRGRIFIDIQIWRGRMAIDIDTPLVYSPLQGVRLNPRLPWIKDANNARISRALTPRERERESYFNGPQYRVSVPFISNIPMLIDRSTMDGWLLLVTTRFIITRFLCPEKGDWTVRWTELYRVWIGNGICNWYFFLGNTVDEHNLCTFLKVGRKKEIESNWIFFLNRIANLFSLLIILKIPRLQRYGRIYFSTQCLYVTFFSCIFIL